MRRVDIRGAVHGHLDKSKIVKIYNNILYNLDLSKEKSFDYKFNNSNNIIISYEKVYCYTNIIFNYYIDDKNFMIHCYSNHKSNKISKFLFM